MVRTESLEIKDGRKKAMQCLTQTESRAQFSPAIIETIEIPEASGNLYRTLQQEVELGAQALRSERADRRGFAAANSPVPTRSMPVGHAEARNIIFPEMAWTIG